MEVFIESQYAIFIIIVRKQPKDLLAKINAEGILIKGSTVHIFCYNKILQDKKQEKDISNFFINIYKRTL